MGFRQARGLHRSVRFPAFGPGLLIAIEGRGRRLGGLHLMGLVAAPAQHATQGEHHAHHKGNAIARPGALNQFDEFLVALYIGHRAYLLVATSVLLGEGKPSRQWSTSAGRVQVVCPASPSRRGLRATVPSAISLSPRISA